MLDKNKLIKYVAILAFIIVGCSFLARSMNSSGTLYEYAKEHPEFANDEVEETLSGPEGTKDETGENVSETSEPILIETSSDEGNLVETSVASTHTEESPTETALESHPERFTYAEGFFYEPITPAIEERIVGISYPAEGSAEVTLDDLAYLNVLYNDFEGGVQTGELICNRSIAPDLLEIFEELYRNNYQFEQIALIDEYGGDDTLSMEHNNTSCFNYRIVDGTDHLSKHAYGLAIDINPFYNPYVVYNKDGTGETYISPKGSEIYADRDKDFPYKIDENDLCYKLFIEHGFTWGGNWNSSKDYQHFQKVQ